MIGTSSMHIDAASVAEELRAARLKADLSQYKLAAVLGVSRRTIVRWEAGKGRLHQIYLRRIRELRDNGPQEASDALK